MRIDFESWQQHWEEEMKINAPEIVYIVATEAIMNNGQYSDAQKVKMINKMREVYKKTLR